MTFHSNPVNDPRGPAVPASEAALRAVPTAGVPYPADPGWGASAAALWMQCAQHANDAVQVADMLAVTWARIDAALRPVIGLAGVAALYKRGLFLAVPSHAWLINAYQTADNTMDTAPLRAVVASQNQVDAIAAGGVLLFEFYQLLASLISSALAARLLRTVLEAVPNGAPAPADSP